MHWSPVDHTNRTVKASMVLVYCCVALFFLLCILLVLIASHFLPLWLNHKATPRGSFGWPIIGETLGFLKPHASNSIGNFLEDHCSRYGKVFRSHLFCSPTIVSCDQELNNFILQNEEKLFQCSYPKPVHAILGKSSMLVVAGVTHKKLRSLALMLVSSTKSNPSYLNDIEQAAARIMESWNDRKRIFFREEARKYTFHVIAKHILGLNPDEPKTTKILEDFLTFMEGLVSLPLYIPGMAYARAVKARARISTTVRSIIEEKSVNNSNPGGFLEILLSVNTSSLDEKVSFVLDSLLGGFETTSALLATAVYFLSHSPPALQQLKLEHQRIRNFLKKGGLLTWEDYKKMEFTQHVINEALRYANIVKFVHRKALTEIKYQDYLIPSGWKVLPVLSAVHLDASIYWRANEFYPWRWKDHNHMACKMFNPFGGGSRLCPGSELAKVETAFFLHHLVLNFRFAQ